MNMTEAINQIGADMAQVLAILNNLQQGSGTMNEEQKAQFAKVVTDVADLSARMEAVEAVVVTLPTADAVNETVNTAVAQRPTADAVGTLIAGALAGAVTQEQMGQVVQTVAADFGARVKAVEDAVAALRATVGDGNLNLPVLTPTP